MERGYHRNEAGDISLTMSADDHALFLILFGYAMGVLLTKGSTLVLTSRRVVELINRLEAGNPHFTPYEIPKGR